MPRIKQAISRDDLLNRADTYNINRWSDGLLNNIKCYQKGVLIHTCTANYQTDNAAANNNRLQDVTGYLYPEVAADYEEWLKLPQTVTGSVLISGPVTVTGAVTVTGTVSISGPVTVNGAVTVTGTVSISGSVTVTGAVTVTGTVSISGSVTVTGTVSISGSVTVTGAVTISGPVTVNGAVTVTGSVTITNASITISGAVTVTSGAITVNAYSTDSSIARPVWYDRNPTTLVYNWNSSGVGPHGTTSRWSYTVPANRKAYVEAATTHIIRQANGSPAGIQFASLYVNGSIILSSSLYTAAATSLLQDNHNIGNSILLLAGDTVQFETSDPSTGGTSFYMGGAKITEFDA